MFAVLGGGVPVAQAQFAVIDVASVTQLVSEVRTLQQQLEYRAGRSRSSADGLSLDRWRSRYGATARRDRPQLSAAQLERLARRFPEREQQLSRAERRFAIPR